MISHIIVGVSFLILGLVLGAGITLIKVYDDVLTVLEYTKNMEILIEQVQNNQEYLKSIPFKDQRVQNLLRGNKSALITINRESERLRQKFD